MQADFFGLFQEQCAYGYHCTARGFCLTATAATFPVAMVEVGPVSQSCEFSWSDPDVSGLWLLFIDHAAPPLVRNCHQMEKQDRRHGDGKGRCDAVSLVHYDISSTYAAGSDSHTLRIDEPCEITKTRLGPKFICRAQATFCQFTWDANHPSPVEKLCKFM